MFPQEKTTVSALFGIENIPTPCEKKGFPLQGTKKNADMKKYCEFLYPLERKVVNKKDEKTPLLKGREKR